MAETGNLCDVPGCIKKRGKNRRKCHACVKQLVKERDPIRNAFYDLRGNAKKRGKDFTLTFDEFKNFAIETDLLSNRGITATSWHIDRIDDTRGYTIDNIQILTNTENVKKENRRRKLLKYDAETRRCKYVIDYSRNVNFDSVPF